MLDYPTRQSEAIEIAWHSHVAENQINLDAAFYQIARFVPGGRGKGCKAAIDKKFR
jgi:hypothetical protein